MIEEMVSLFQHKQTDGGNKKTCRRTSVDRAKGEGKSLAIDIKSQWSAIAEPTEQLTVTEERLTAVANAGKYDLDDDVSLRHVDDETEDAEFLTRLMTTRLVKKLSVITPRAAAQHHSIQSTQQHNHDKPEQLTEQAMQERERGQRGEEEKGQEERRKRVKNERRRKERELRKKGTNRSRRT